MNGDQIFATWLQGLVQVGALGLLTGILYHLFKIVPTAIKDQVDSYQKMLEKFHEIVILQQESFSARNEKITTSIRLLEISLQQQQSMLSQQTEQIRELFQEIKDSKKS